MSSPPLFFIGGLPFRNADDAIEFVRRSSARLPFLPQLPGINSQEDPVGQILRGFEIGYWDEEASVCLPHFIHAFSNAYRVKIQMAGPFTVSRAISRDFLEIAPQWLALATNIVDQFRKAGMKGEIWLQIDEPVWSKTRNLPQTYGQFLKLAASLERATVLGLHSCASQRPPMESSLLRLVRFLSLNFSETPLTAEEGADWQSLLAKGHHLIAGILPKPGEKIVETGGGFPWSGDRVWVSTPCGLSDWDLPELEKLIRTL